MEISLATSTPAQPTHEIKTRRISFSYPSGSLQKHYVQGDLIMSHFIATLSAMFPEGEEFFIRSVRNSTDSVTDPVLKKAVGGFIGQEVTHGREHRELNEQLHEMGYPTRRIERQVIRGLTLTERFAPKLYPLAVTAALEHYTATIAELLLTEPKAQALLGNSEVRSILLWHALEESEHKAVAFDVYRVAGGSEKMRIIAMRIITFTFLFSAIGNTALSMLADKATYNPFTLIKSLLALRHSPFTTRKLIRDLRAYNKPGYHPNDHENAELLTEWTAKLFGEQGQLVGNLK